MNDHISKPIDPENLFVIVGRYYKPTEPAAKSAVAQAPQADDGLPSVAGLDAADGLRRVAGNRKLYLKLLRQFVAQQADAPAQILEQFQAGDMASAERIAHTVKGVAGNLGAKTVQAAAAELEKAIRDRAASDQVETLRQNFSAALAALIEPLRAALGEAPSAPAAVSAAADPEQLKSVVALMRKQLSEFDPAAAEAFETHRGLFAIMFSVEQLGQFEKHLQGYAFAEAQALLETAAQAHGI